MSWKERLTRIKVGDKVKLIKPCDPEICGCDQETCDDCFEMCFNVMTVLEIYDNGEIRAYNCREIEKPDERCDFTKYQLEKI